MKKRLFDFSIVTISTFSLCALLTPTTVRGVVISAAVCVLVLALMWLFHDKLPIEMRINRKFLVFDATLLVLLGRDFYTRWLPSSKIVAIARILKVSKHFFLVGSAFILGLVSIWAVNLGFVFISSLLSKYKNVRNESNTLVAYIKILLIILLQYCCLGVSSVGVIGRTLFIPLDALIANLSILFFVNLLFFLPIRNWNRSLTITSVIFFVWGLANYYTIQFHGSPLYLSEFPNFLSAAAVVMNYRFQVTVVVISVFLLFLSELIIIKRETFVLAKSKLTKVSIVVKLTMLLLFAFLTFACSISGLSRFQAWRPWDLSMDVSGFVLCLIEDVNLRANPIDIPKAYNEAGLAFLNGVKDNQEELNQNKQEYPDIILILNETFCDLETYVDLDADTDYLHDFYFVDGAVYGYAVTPKVGGGTNNSEYELLTSKSMYLLKSSAPFTYLNTECLERSTIQYLDSFDYETVGMHCGNSRSYSRNKAYPLVGFDSILLGEECFTYFERNGKRPWLDSGNYKDLIEQFENMGESPRFLYLLTFQNHGGYEQNTSDLDTIHVQNDFGSLTDDINEYLSSIELSSKAFHELTEYFSDCGRKVIICMVGDHAPSFIQDLQPKHSMSFEESEIAKRKVPYVIWTNFDTDISLFTEYASMTDLFPMVMQIAGIPRTAFYQYVLDLHEILPFRTSNGIYMDRSGVYGVYSEKSPYYDILTQYYYFEYNSLASGDEYRKELFELW